MSYINQAKTTKIKGIITELQEFRFCNPDDDPIEQHNVTSSYYYLLTQLQILATPILSEPIASRLEGLSVEIGDLYSALSVHPVVEALLCDIETAVDKSEKILSVDNGLPVQSLKKILQTRDLPGINIEFDRALANVEQDPPAAITAACSILESLFKTYIEEFGLDLPGKQSLIPLWKTVKNHLIFFPTAIEDNDKNKILSGITSVVAGIGSLRTHTSSAHGHGKCRYQLSQSHARLTVHASYSIVVFVIESWENNLTDRARSLSA